MSEPKACSGASEEPGGRIPETFRFRWRFPFVMITALLLSVGQPLSLGVFADQGTFDVLCTLLIFAVMHLVFEERQHRRIALPLGLLALLSLWISHACPEPMARWLLIIAHLLAAGFMAFAIFGIISSVLLWRVTQNAIPMAICGYLLLGILWMLIYTAVETAVPGSFRMPVEDTASAAPVRSVRSLLGYFSFITLATVGYGDVTPVTPLARTLAWLEAVVGQFYLGILVAGLVGLKVTLALERDRTSQNNS